MTRTLIFTTLAVLLATPASAACLMSYCKKEAPTRSYIVNNHRQIVGDLYDPGYNRRIQIRDLNEAISYGGRSGNDDCPARAGPRRQGINGPMYVLKVCPETGRTPQNHYVLSH